MMDLALILITAALALTVVVALYIYPLIYQVSYVASLVDVMVVIATLIYS